MMTEEEQANMAQMLRSCMEGMDMLFFVLRALLAGFGAGRPEFKTELARWLDAEPARDSDDARIKQSARDFIMVEA
jgi:hypothetical protein